MGGKKHNYHAWEERTISEVNVEYHLRSYSRNSLLAAVGNENREGRMTYVVAKEYLEAFGSNATINAYTQWRNRDDVVQWLISLVRNVDSPPAISDSDLVPKNKRHGSSIDEEEKPAQGNTIKSFPKKLRSSLVHQKQDTGRSNAINLVPPKEAGCEPTGQFTPGEYSNRVEKFFGMSIRTFRGLCTLVKEPLCNSPKYKFNDNRELTVDAKVAIAMRRLKLGKSLNSIGNEIGMHSFTVDKVTRSFVEAVNGLSHLHGPGAATKEGMSAETLDSAVEEGMSVEKLDRLKEEWKVLTTGMKPEKLRSMIKACCILHNIVTDMND